MNKILNKKSLIFPYYIWVIGFIIIPLILIFVYGITDRYGNFTMANIMAIGVKEHLKALSLSMFLSLIATLICLILSFPIALILREKELKTSSFIVFIFILPMWMNFLLRTLAWQTLLERKGVINGILTFLHLPNISIINTPYAIILGMVYNFLPFMILPIYNSLIKIENNTIEAARDLGADFIQVLINVIFPLSLPGVISGISMVFVPALTTFIISNLLGGSKILLIGNVIDESFTKASNWNLGAGLSLVLMIFILISMAFIAKYDSGEVIA